MEDRLSQYDIAHGCLDLRVPADHEARRIWATIARLDISKTEQKYSSLGTRGYPPRRTLAVWVYASRHGIHHSTALAERIRTDSALLWLAGGHEMSEGHLRKFRRENRELFADALTQTVKLAVDEGLLKVEELAVDSMRLRAEASSGAVRTVRRSTKRLGELAATDSAQLSDAEREAHEAKLAKHREALLLCAKNAAPNVVLTNPSAGLMKFPNGASAPGHRVTATAAGVKERIVVDIFIDADGNDAGKLRMALMRCRQALKDVGIPVTAKASFVADAGYASDDDLKAAEENADWAEVIVDVGDRSRRQTATGEQMFTVDDFRIDERNIATCPAGTEMAGPYPDGEGATRWNGRGCATCPLKSRCTKAKVKSLTLKDGYTERRDAMKRKRTSAEGRERYGKRMATVEPVFSYLEDVMHFTRASSRLADAVVAEIMLKVLTYNLYRLRTAKRVSRVRLVIALTATGELHIALPAAA